MNARVIRQLPESVINQIAAGEVVERPASIVKELLENALDAGAGSVDIELEEGGIGRIQVRDDGSGIPADQLALALTRHCTSKIASADDLPVLVTLGFRGEALAAIGSVAETSITSRTADAPHGWRIAQQASRAPGSVAPAAHPRGTTVIARDLFAQVPARRRFLKRPQTELLHILNLVRRVAFCAPGVAFTVAHDGRPGLQLPAASDARAAERRQRALFGAEFASRARYLDVVADGVRVFGWVGGAALAHSQADLQMLAVNGRVIRDRHLAHAVRMAFEAQLPAGRFPSFALHLEMAPDAVDVNVHPGKIEVRFGDLRTVHDVLHAAVRDALSRPAPAAGAPTTYADEAAPAVRATSLLRDAAARPPVLPPPRVEAPRPAGTVSVAGAPAPEVLAVIEQRYAVVAEEGGCAVVDLAALVEQTVVRRLAQPWTARPLVIPVRIECADEPGAARLAAKLEALGLELTPLGGRTLALRALPIALPPVDPSRLAAALAACSGDSGAGLLAAAAGAALQVPAARERAAWLARLLGAAGEAGVEAARYRRALGAAALGRLFAGADA
jgi:DNA mismatch repair protein MutL